jgi:hypothetical protein
MSNKGIIVALVVLGALVAALVFSRASKRGETSALDDAPTSGFQAFLDMEANDVASLEVVQGDTTVKVTKKGSDFVLDSSYGYAADAEKIDGFLEEIKKIESGRRRARKASSHEKFEVDKDKGVAVSFFGAGNKKLASMVLGKSSQGRTLAQKSYVRFGDEPTVFEVGGSVRSRVGGGTELDNDYFLDKDIFKLEDDREIFEATLARADHNVILERRWVSSAKEKAEDKTPDGDAAAEEKKDEPPELEWKEEFYAASGSKSFLVKDKEWTAKSYLNNNNNLRAEEAIEPKDLKEYGLDSPQLKVALKHRIKGLHTNPDAKTDDKTLTVFFGNVIKDDKGEDSKYYAMVEGQERIFAVSKYTYEKYSKDLKDFEPTPKEEPKEAGQTGDAAPAPVTPDPGSPGTLEGGLIEPASLDDADPVDSGETSAAPATPEGGLIEPASLDDADPVDSEETSAAPATPAPTRVRASHILIPYKGSSRVPSDVTRTKDEARTEVAKILAEIQKDNSKFEALAKEHSSCPSSSRGGDLGSFGRGGMAKPFDEASFNLQPGEISGVVETDFGFHIIKRTE